MLDLGDPARPETVASFEGSAHRRGVLCGEVLVLWSPGFAASPAVLSVDDAGPPGSRRATDAVGHAVR